MKRKITEILIVTRSVVLQQGLGALLESLSGITSVKAIQQLSNTYTWIEAHQPKIVFLDMAVSGKDSRTVLEKIQILSPDTKRLLLVDTVEDVRWAPQYAEGILVKGESPSTVATIVTDLLFSKGEEDEYIDSNR
jgi:DNA-binding NarL/FixJ family response regulator